MQQQNFLCVLAMAWRASVCPSVCLSH